MSEMQQRLRAEGTNVADSTSEGGKSRWMSKMQRSFLGWQTDVANPTFTTHFIGDFP